MRLSEKYNVRWRNDSSSLDLEEKTEIVRGFRDLEEKLAEYENDETVRRRADAYKIRQLSEWPKDCVDGKDINEKSPAGDG